MIKQSAAILALFLGTSKAARRAPESVSYFATGMNGDEDMAEDITMKGDQFHYLQKNNVTANATASTANATKAANVTQPVKAAKTQGKATPVASKKGCSQGEVASADGNCYFEGEAVQFVQIGADPPEKVLTLEPKYGLSHSTFMVQLEDDKIHETEKVHALEPIPAQVASNSFDAFPNQRTAFYAQVSDDSQGVRPYSMEGYTEPEKVLKPDARITHTYTTFYDKKNKIWMGDNSILAQTADDAIAGPSAAPIGAWVHGQGMEAGEGIANPRNLAQATPNMRNKGKKTAADPISPEDMDPWVYRFSRDNTSTQTQWHAQKSKVDINEAKMDEEVHGFASDNVDVLPTVFQTGVYANNGQGASAHKGLEEYGPRPNYYGGVSYASKNKKDISENGIEPNVHRFASDNVDVLPNRFQSDAYAMNGQGAGGWGSVEDSRAANDNGYNYAQAQRKPDISENGIEPNVHRFATDNVDVLPTRFQADNYAMNGQGAGGWGSVENSRPAGHYNFGQRKPDIAEPGMEPNVHRFASDNVDVLPRLRREDDPYPANGVSSGFPEARPNAFAQPLQKKKKDINEAKMDEEVHGFASDNVDVLPTRFQGDAYAMNGQGGNGWGSVEDSHAANYNRYGYTNYAQKSDIANHEVRPDVWVEVHKMINPTSVHRAPEAPPSTYQASPPPGGYDAEPEAANPTPKEVDDKSKKAAAPEEQKSAKKAEPVKKTPENEDGDLDPPKHEEEEVLTRADPPAEEAKEGEAGKDAGKAAGPVEKVHEINPMDFQERANTNAPGPRTTFYDKKHSLWRQASVLVSLQ